MTERASPDRPGVVSSGWLAANSTFTRVDDRRRGRAFVASLVLHGLGLLGVLAVMAWAPRVAIEQLTRLEKVDLVFLQAPGPGGGGGGGNRMSDPPRKLEMKAELPKPVVLEPVKADIPPPTLVAPIQSHAAVLQTAGAIIGLTGAPSLGPGPGTGSGPGDGPGVGPGPRRGFGGDVMGEGSDAQPPTLLRGVDPKYTTEAMRAKVQGTVTLEAVIAPDGTVRDIRVVKSLDRIHGLDEAALRTARQWQFRPAMFQGRPVAYLVLIELSFNLR
jgi:periplasmic protein TonB